MSTYPRNQAMQAKYSRENPSIERSTINDENYSLFHVLRFY